MSATDPYAADSYADFKRIISDSLDDPRLEQWVGDDFYGIRSTNFPLIARLKEELYDGNLSEQSIRFVEDRRWFQLVFLMTWALPFSGVEEFKVEWAKKNYSPDWHLYHTPEESLVLAARAKRLAPIVDYLESRDARDVAHALLLALRQAIGYRSTPEIIETLIVSLEDAPAFFLSVAMLDAAYVGAPNIVERLLTKVQDPKTLRYAYMAAAAGHNWESLHRLESLVRPDQKLYLDALYEIMNCGMGPTHFPALYGDSEVRFIPWKVSAGAPETIQDEIIHILHQIRSPDRQESEFLSGLLRTVIHKGYDRVITVLIDLGVATSGNLADMMKSANPQHRAYVMGLDNQKKYEILCDMISALTNDIGPLKSLHQSIGDFTESSQNRRLLDLGLRCKHELFLEYLIGSIEINDPELIKELKERLENNYMRYLVTLL